MRCDNVDQTEYGVNFAGMREWTVNVCRMRERIKQDAQTSLLMRERILFAGALFINMDWLQSQHSRYSKTFYPLQSVAQPSKFGNGYVFLHHTL